MDRAIFSVGCSGSRPTTLFIHGAGQSSAYWEPMLKHLEASGMAGAALDLPGFGRSAAVGGPYSLPALASAVADWIARGGEPVMLVANSMGGTVAQLVALDHPHWVHRLVLAASGPFMPDGEGVAKRWQNASAEWSRRDVEAGVRRYFQWPDEQPMLERFYHDARLASEAASIESMLSNAETSTLQRLGEIRVPTLIVQGRHDRTRTVEHGEMMRSHIPDARLCVLERSGHTPHLDEPDAFAALVLPFLKDGQRASQRTG